MHSSKNVVEVEILMPEDACLAVNYELINLSMPLMPIEQSFVLSLTPSRLNCLGSQAMSVYMYLCVYIQFDLTV